MYMEMDRCMKEIVMDYVDSISSGGVYRRSDTETVSAIYWNI